MNTLLNPVAVFEQTDTRKLIDEIDRYLAAVDLFRAEDREPTWRPELSQDDSAQPAGALWQRLPSDISLH